MRNLLVIVLASTVLMAMSCCQSGGHSAGEEVRSPQGPEKRSPDAAFEHFFSRLRIGMSRKAFNYVVDEHQFKDGLVLLPVIVSLSDPNRHLNIPPHGVYVFYFDSGRGPVGWQRWAENGTKSYGYTNGGLSATLTLSPTTKTNR